MTHFLFKINSSIMDDEATLSKVASKGQASSNQLGSKTTMVCMVP